MSRTRNERSVSTARGRKGEMKTKGRSHRRVSGMIDIEDTATAKRLNTKETLDR